MLNANAARGQANDEGQMGIQQGLVELDTSGGAGVLNSLNW